MKITVILPHEAQLATAGVRIRYERLRAHLQEAGHTIDLRTIDTFRTVDAFRDDVYLFCKCHDARAPLLAQAIFSAGRRVGIDIFDDYYSQTDDSRFVHLRRWLRQITPWIGFALCATAPMQTRLQALLPGLPLHVLNDPFGQLDAAVIAAAVDGKLAQTLASGVIEMGWFGIGDNSYFSLGLDDLSAFGGALATCRAAGWVPRLTVLTNRRALTVPRLEMLSRLPVPVHVEEWTEALERDLVAQSLLCFLPVNAQPFSVVKSLNRAVTALTGGAQVLSAGYPLYDPLGAFVYRDVAALLRDLERGTLRMRRQTLGMLTQTLSASADPATEAAGLATFLDALKPPPKLKPAATAGTDRSGITAVIHGVANPGAVHKLAQRSRVLSVASTLTATSMNYDIRPLDGPGSDGTELSLLMSERACDLLAPADQARLVDPRVIDDKTFRRLPMACPALAGSGLTLRLEKLAAYGAAIGGLAAILTRLYPGIRILLSEGVTLYWAGSDPAMPGVERLAGAQPDRPAGPDDAKRAPHAA
jgi:hypothetical protein